MVAQIYVIETKKKGSKHWKIWPGSDRLQGLFRTRGLAKKGAKQLHALWFNPKNLKIQVTLYVASIAYPVD